MIKYTKTTLDKLIKIFESHEYIVRFEKGTFQSGYAIVKEKKIVVINKYFDREARIIALMEILDIIKINPDILETRLQKFYKDLIKQRILFPR